MDEADIYLTIRPGTTVHNRAEAAEEKKEPAEKAPEVKQNYPGTVAAAVLARPERYGSQHVREAHDGLAEIGYVLYPSVPRDPNGQPQSYLRIHGPNRPGPAIGHLAPQKSLIHPGQGTAQRRARRRDRAQHGRSRVLPR